MGGSHSHATATQSASSDTTLPPAPTASTITPPALDGPPTELLADPANLLLLASSVPATLRVGPWNLLYSSTVHGRSYSRLLYLITAEGPTIVVIKDTKGHIFGGFTDCSWRCYPHFYGGYNCFVFSFAPGNPTVYKASGRNDNFMYMNHGASQLFNGFAMGGQMDMFTWSVDESVERGHSYGPSLAFGSPQLASGTEYEVDCIEIFRVGPAERTLEIQRIQSAKRKANKSVLEDDGNPNKGTTLILTHLALASVRSLDRT